MSSDDEEDDDQEEEEKEEVYGITTALSLTRNQVSKVPLWVLVVYLLIHWIATEIPFVNG